MIERYICHGLNALEWSNYEKAFRKDIGNGVGIAVFMTGNMYAYAGYHETTSNHTYAGIQDSCIC